jgi:hypothetical protein
MPVIREKNASSRLVLTALPLVLFFMHSCVKDLGPGAVTCDTTNITYSGQIGTILKTNCEFQGCHNGSNIQAGAPDYTSYSGIKTQATNGNLFSYALGPNRTMPLAGSPGPAALTACDFQILQLWINKGSPQ